MAKEHPTLFVGGLFDEQQRREVQQWSTGPVQSAADALQWGYVRGLEADERARVTVLSAPFLGSFPKRYRQAWVPSRRFQRGSDGGDRVVGFLNLVGIKHIWRAVALSAAVRTWLRSVDDSPTIVAYAMTLPTVYSAWTAKLRRRDALVYLIIPDLPEFMDTSTSADPLRKILKAAESGILRTMTSRFNGQILLTKYMSERLPDIPHLVVEGIVSRETESSETLQTSHVDPYPEERVLLYSGTLNRRYGVLRLCEAFRLLPDSSLRLVLCGSGDAEEEVRKHAEEDRRIIFKGQIPRDEVMMLQTHATVLVNPRMNNEAFARYSFPSKIIEYMGAGRPVLCYKLDGIPDEYDQFLSYVPGSSIEDFAESIARITSLPPSDLREQGERARQFVLTAKNPVAQVRRVLDFCWGSRRPAADGAGRAS
ncbi:MAG: glycosyltransferase [Propionicimonas sp.]